jgi:hypothetical protein
MMALYKPNISFLTEHATDAGVKKEAQGLKEKVSRYL